MPSIARNAIRRARPWHKLATKYQPPKPGGKVYEANGAREMERRRAKLEGK